MFRYLLSFVPSGCGSLAGILAIPAALVGFALRSIDPAGEARDALRIRPSPHAVSRWLPPRPAFSPREGLKRWILGADDRCLERSAEVRWPNRMLQPLAEARNRLLGLGLARQPRQAPVKTPRAVLPWASCSSCRCSDMALAFANALRPRALEKRTGHRSGKPASGLASARGLTGVAG